MGSTDPPAYSTFGSPPSYSQHPPQHLCTLEYQKNEQRDDGVKVSITVFCQVRGRWAGRFKKVDCARVTRCGLCAGPIKILNGLVWLREGFPLVESLHVIATPK